MKTAMLAWLARNLTMDGGPPAFVMKQKTI
jgi:hypothetical protein